MAVLLYEAVMRKDKTPKEKEKEVQEKLNRLNRNIEECERTRIRMEQIIEKYKERMKDIDLLQETYESLISTHNDLIDQLMQKINNN